MPVAGGKARLPLVEIPKNIGHLSFFAVVKSLFIHTFVNYNTSVKNNTIYIEIYDSLYPITVSQGRGSTSPLLPFLQL